MNAIQKVNGLTATLEKAKTVAEVKEVRDQAKAIADYLKRRDGHHIKQNEVAELKLRAEYKLGELIPKQFPHGGEPTSRNGSLTLKQAGISFNQSSRWQSIRSIPTTKFDEFIAEAKTDTKFELTTAAALELAKEFKSEALTAEENEAMKAALEKADLPESCDMRQSSMQELLVSDIKPDAIITDPPYPKEFLPVYGELAKLAVGVPMVAVMCGQSYLPDIMALMCPHLKYRWTAAYLTPGANLRQWERKVDCGWKPILIFGEAEEYIYDLFKSDADDKRFHGWGQSESGIADLITRLTKPGQLVCDPFLGGGTTAIVSLSLGRRFVGCDIDPSAVETSRGRVAKFLNDRA